MIKNCLTILFPLLLTVSFSQSHKDSLAVDIAVDSTGVNKVKMATILSACLPGAGQVYNHINMPKGKKKAYWKVPLIYGGLGVTGYFAYKLNQDQKQLKADYINLTENGIQSTAYPGYDAQALLEIHRKKLTQRDLMFIGIGVVYILNIVDAAVEAHFVKFDVSENLSMSVRPSFMGGLGVGVGMSLSFKK